MTINTHSATRRLLVSSPPQRLGVKLPRQIVRLSFAWLLNERPSWIPKPKRQSGSKAQGLAYEKKVVREVKNRLCAGSWHYHQWIQYRDHDGKEAGWCEPELYTVLSDRVILLEVKLTGGIAGRMQLEGLYRPLLEFIYKKPVYCLLVCKHINKDTPGPFFSGPEDFMRSGESFGTWHWLPTP
jgi:hypothetical protein